MRLRKLWPQTLLGCASIGILAATVPAAIPYALLIAGGLALAVPFAVVTAYAPVGNALVRLGVGRLPEETSPAVLRPLALPAIEALAPQSSPSAAQASECSKA